MAESGSRYRRVRQVIMVIAALTTAFVLFLAVLISTGLPGTAGDFFARIATLVTTPFLLEITIAISGALLVIMVNHWRRVRDGDEFVDLEELERRERTTAEPGANHRADG